MGKLASRFRKDDSLKSFHIAYNLISRKNPSVIRMKLQNNNSLLLYAADVLLTETEELQKLPIILCCLCQRIRGSVTAEG